MTAPIEWQLFPKHQIISEDLQKVLDVFKESADSISSNEHELASDDVLEILRPGLERIGYQVEKGKKAEDKIRIPVLFGRNGRIEKAFDVDAFNIGARTIIEVEAGRAVINYQFLKDLFQACMMQNVDHLVIAVRIRYKRNRDLDKVVTFIETLYASGRLQLPLKSIFIIGY